MSKIVQEDLRLVGSLRDTAKQYSDLKRDRAETAVKLYETFLKDYVFPLQCDKRSAAKELKKFFGKSKIKVVAIDGTKYERARRGCIAFYVLATPLVYELDLDAEDLRPRRLEEEILRNNIMALIPVPLSEIFLMSAQSLIETEKIEEEVEEPEEELGDFFAPQKIGRIDVVMMKLAEVYATYWCLKNIKPDAIMIDGSLFEDYSYSNRSVDRLTMFKGEVLGERITLEDFIMLKSFPISADLGIPSPTFTREFLVAELLTSKEVKIDKKSLKFQSTLAKGEVKITSFQLNNWKNLDYLDITEDKNDVIVKLKDEYHQSWNKLQSFFLKVCEEGFGKNNLEAFKVYSLEDAGKSYRYICEEDIETLCRVGYNMIFEECWRSGTLLFSITKDSYVRFFVDNFLTIGGPRHLGIFGFNQKLLPRIPSTDAGMLYDISLRVEGLHPPLFLMEYDPAISTVYSSYDTQSSSYVLNQLRRVAQEREFLRSLVQISEDSTGRKSLVFTVDRLVYPSFDKSFQKLSVPLGGKQYDFAYYSKPSELMKIIVDLMVLTSSNKHDAVFGYPDPLFEADQYVKTLGKAHLETLDLALTEIDLEEFSVTYRQMREIGGG